MSRAGAGLRVDAMTTVFISWGSPDREPATKLAARLKAVGLDVFFSDDDMHAGQRPDDRVKQVINRAVVSVFALSNQSVKRSWVKDEIAWAAFASDPKGPLPMRRLIPVVVGELDEAKIPSSIHRPNLHRFDLTDPARRERRLARLLDEIFEVLGNDLPIVVPSALLAVNREDADKLFASKPKELGHLISLCMAAGMDRTADHATLTAKLAPRYGPTVDEYRPFHDQPPLLELIGTAMRDLNEKRGKERPIHLRWDHAVILGGNQLSDDFRESRRASSCLTIVDSISAFWKPIRDALLEMPVPRHENRHGLVWVPPYFQKADELLDLTNRVTRSVGPLQDAFVDWQQVRRRWVAFDTGTQASFQQWLWRAVSDLASPAEALESNVAGVSKRYTSPMRPKGFYSTS